MYRKIFFMLLLFPAVVFGKTVILRNMQVKTTFDKTQFHFVLSARPSYRAFMMDHPARYIIDFKHVNTFKVLGFHPSLKSAVKSFRYAKHPGNELRLVFELKKNVRVTTGMQLDRFSHQMHLHVTFRKNHLVQLPSPMQFTHNSIMHDIAAEKASYTKPKKQNTEIMENEGRHRDVIVVIDPGHGGKDPGAIGLGGTKEKNVVLAISKKLCDWINKTPGYHAVLTRSGDYYLTLRERLRMARKDRADMFVAIHADTWRNRQARGVSVFALSQRGATSEAARWLAARENASELMGGVDLHDQSHLLKSVLINLSQAATIRSSLQIGRQVIDSVRPIARLHHNRVEQAAFVVLKSPDIPSLLVETGFLSNSHEENRLDDPQYQAAISHSIQRGICGYFSHYPPRGTWLSYWRARKNNK
jgi:N-acetylmuramoyl-L-alanine amidase